MNQSVLLIAEQAVASLNHAAARSHPDETGGILVGVYVDGHPWVTHVIEIPSPDRGRHHYRIPGGTTHPAVNKARETDIRLGYLGDWHSHPADVGPSPTDLASLALISYRRPRRPNPTTIVARKRGDGYVLDARRIVGVQVRSCDLRVTGSLEPRLEGGAVTGAFDVTDPIFISYRQSDGTTITSALAWLLRAAGIPVWRDKDDLPPGDTEERLAQAISDGLSGAVLVITPEIAKSDVVKTVEAPRLVALHQKHSEFALGIANAIERAPGKTDYTAPDRLLELTPKTLEGTDQKSVDRQGLRELVQGLLWHRIAEHRALVAANHSTFSLSIQTRNIPQVYDRTGAQLDIRVRPSGHERLPDASGLRDLALAIGLLPDAVTRSGAQRVCISGGAHLSVAFALGASLPSSRIGRVEVVDQREVTWASGDEAAIHDPAVLRVKSEGAGASPTDGRPEVAIYLDLLPNPSDAAFDRFLDERGPGLVAWQHVESVQPGLLDPGEAAAISGEAAARIRSLSTTNSNAHVHLLLRSPFPVAVLLGRLMNTIRVTVYEWDDSDPACGDDYRPRYVPTMTVRASATDGVITEVLV